MGGGKRGVQSGKERLILEKDVYSQRRVQPRRKGKGKIKTFLSLGGKRPGKGTRR